MVAIANLEKDIGVINPCSNTLGKNPKSSSFQDIKDCAKSCLKDKGKYLELGAAIGFCSLIKREVINKIGGWDEIFSPGYFEDTDYSKQFAWSIGYSEGDFWDGYEREVWGGIQWRPKDNINLRYNSELNHVEGVSDIEDGSETDFIVSRFKMEWTLSLRLFTRLNVQYVHEDNTYYTNALLGYKFAPESHFYLVYDDDRSELLGWETVQDRKIKAKIVYFLQI